MTSPHHPKPPTTSDIAHFTSVFRAQSLSSDQRPAKVTKRNRPPVSCLACRVRKLRCDRAQPCGACSKRGDAHACKFGPAQGGAVNGSANANAVLTLTARADGICSNSIHRQDGKAAAGQQRQEVQLRLQKLEDMVQDLVNRGSVVTMRDQPLTVAGPTTVPTPTDSDSGNNDTPAPIPTDGEDVYHGATHWTALLHHIREIQTALLPDQTVLPTPPEGGACTLGPDFLFGAVSPATLPQILSSLPPRQDTDRLLGVYFRAGFTSVPFLHTVRFQREYEAFWAAPETTSVLWISILFSVIAAAAIIVRGKGNASSLGLMVQLRDPSVYTGRAVQCLIKGDYLAARTYSVEATLMCAHTRVIGSKDTDPILWNMFGVATRLAQRRGYHLEPRHLSVQISPFEAEMRRRAWFYCEAFDLLLSFQLGMPAIIHEGDNDALGPGNYSDEDFDEETTEMPPERPPTEATPALHYSWKSKLCRILRRVIRHALSPSRPAYEDTLALDDALHRWHDALPACLRVRPIRSTGFAEHNWVIMYRLMLELTWSKALCVLHRGYLSREWASDERFSGSRETCRGAALRILDLHAEFDREASLGGRLFEDRYMLSSLTLHDFMIAAMVVCLDLNESTDTSDEDYEKKMAALKTASDIWTRRADCSKDARHAAIVLKAMVRRLTSQRRSGVGAAAGCRPTAAMIPHVSGNGNTASFGQASSLNIGSGVDVFDRINDQAQATWETNTGDEFDFMALDNALNDSSALDWSLLDQYLLIDRKG
ncbi:putative transcriptional regulatory protein C1F7.11c 5 [Colletotrichum chlorophyti]|uniref:Putative transcriptional regulatory protein C1F7.11c 5 n=1 Tax=Colletotrichum chlorophyti TaxID=708187 RepID=A0A1Q8RCZ8_9PEZI|nr:putative transcriptional regulatory protein C1F7.11c 5 [Colletotrichum chlorophyti]